MTKVNIEISARHVHLSQNDLEVLFGSGYKLAVYKNLSQPGQFSSQETVDIKSRNNTIEKIRIVGPIREQTQVELSLTDCRLLKIDAPILVSGNLNNSVGDIIIVGPHGTIKLKKGVIVAQRHLHIEPDKAKTLNIQNGDLIAIKINGQRSLIFNNVAVRSRKDIDKFVVHLDTDEANAAGIDGENTGEIIV
ncbi:MAG: phosphate propanoyltransferase [Patescibacteria group bacterium]|nr:phosphate propanoyltransferase [Patescibacteria group bacterium]